MAYYERKDMEGLSAAELIRGISRSIDEERALMDSGKGPEGSIRLRVQTTTFLHEALKRVSPKPEPSWPDTIR